MTNNEVLAAFAALSPNVRFKAVADGMDEFVDMTLDRSRGVPGATSFKRHADQMREALAQWETEDAAEATRERLAAELFQVMYNTMHENGFDWVATARALLGQFDITPKVA